MILESWLGVAVVSKPFCTRQTVGVISLVKDPGPPSQSPAMSRNDLLQGQVGSSKSRTAEQLVRNVNSRHKLLVDQDEQVFLSKLLPNVETFSCIIP